MTTGSGGMRTEVVEGFASLRTREAVERGMAPSPSKWHNGSGQRGDGRERRNPPLEVRRSRPSSGTAFRYA